MAAARPLTAASGRTDGAERILLVRAGTALALLLAWEALARSGLLYRDVVPSLVAIAGAFVGIVTSAAFYRNLGVTAGEVAGAMVFGGGLGMCAGLALGFSPFLSRAYENILYYLAPTPKIIFFPVMLMLLGVGPESKSALAGLSCFFPVAFSVSAGIRGVDPVLVRVGRSLGMSRPQMLTKVYLPAMRAPLLNGLRLGLGLAIIGALLAETKLSRAGLGFMTIDFFQRFDIPSMYAVLLIVCVLSIVVNGVLDRIGRPPSHPA